ncbi:MAG: hypothetical protein H6834_01210 [Planctomycetes bacterium]|nr:hypothetical protein [Planctomycetota bacterium]
MPLTKDLTDRAKAAIDAARQLAESTGEPCIGTGHLIFGLTSDHLSIGNRIFNDINIYPEMFRDHLKKLPKESDEGDSNGFHPLVALTIDRGRKARRKLGGGTETTTDHLLVALLSLREGTAFECLREFSVEPEEISLEMLEAMGFDMTDRPEW